MAVEPFRHHFWTFNIFELFEPDIVFFSIVLVCLFIGTNFGRLRGSFLPFSRSKSRFMDYLRVSLESLRNCFGNVFGLKRLTVRHIVSSKDCQDIPSFEV